MQQSSRRRAGSPFVVFTVAVTLTMSAAAIGGLPNSQPASASSCAHGFVDVPDGAFFGDAVAWMAGTGVTTGTSPSTFSPDAFVTRGQFAAFLWRYAGEPPAGVHGFVDVPDGAFFADAVAWMAGTGVTTGTSPSTFSPDAFVTRGQLAAFLWRYDGEPDPCAAAAGAPVPTTTLPAASSSTTTLPGSTSTTVPGPTTTSAPTTTAAPTTTVPVTTTTVDPGDPPAPGTMAELLWTYEQVIEPTYGDAYPWIDVAWDFIHAEGTVSVADLPGSVAGRVQTGCSYSFSRLPSCSATSMVIDPVATDDVDVIVHELAHVFERTHGLAPDRDAQGHGQLYFEVTYGERCDDEELHADAMARAAVPDSYPYYWRNTCPDAPSDPGTADLAVVDDWVVGASPDWFVGRYDNGAELWAAIMAADVFNRYSLVTNLQNEFGGYCSVSNTVWVAFAGGTDDNPFADGGC
ncbi:MAG: S-layer homology domain-containing protein [Actinomycetota bacterium]